MWSAMTKDTPSGRGSGHPSLRSPHQPSHGIRRNDNSCRPSPSSFHEAHRREREALRAELETERLRSKEAWHRFAVEARELREAAERDRQLLADQLHSKWEQQRAREIQQLREESKRQREAEIRQLLRWKEAELREAQEFLQRERNVAMRQVRDLQRQLTKELVSHGSACRGARGGGSGGGMSAECRAKLEEVLGKLRWEVDGDQAARIRHLEAELELERRLFLKYILERSEGEPLLSGSLNIFMQVPSSPEGKVHSWRGAGEHAEEGLPQQGWLSGDSSNQLRKQNADLLNARKVLEERCAHLEEENARLRKNSSPHIQEKGKIRKRKSTELAVIAKQLEAAAEKLQATNLRVSNTAEPPALNCSERELWENVLTQRQAKDLNEQDGVLLTKDQQTEDSSARKDNLLNVIDSDHLLRDSQREVLQLQRHIALTSQRDSLQSARTASNGSSSFIMLEASLNTQECLEDSSFSKKKPETLKIPTKDAESPALPFGNEAKNYKNSTLKMASKNQSHSQLFEKQLFEKQKHSENLRDEVEEKWKQWDEVKQKFHKIMKENALICSNSSGSESMQISSNPCFNPEYTEGELEEWETDKVSIQSDNQNPYRLRAFIARCSYDPFKGPNQNPEAELPLTAGEYVYICGEMDEDGFYIGELMDGRRGFVPSNLVEEVHEPSFSCQSASCEEENNSPDEDRCVSLLSDRLEGMLYEVQTAVPYPQNLILLNLRNITATSAEITWFPSNGGYTYLLYLNEKKYDVTKAGICCYTFQNLRPSTQYSVKVEPRVPQEALGSPQEGWDQKAAEMTFTTPSAGPPHAPLDVHVQASSSPDVLLISWLPETIHPSGSSNGVRVTGYAIYISGQKVTEIMSPTAGSVSLDVSRISPFQGPRTVSVRTVSPFGESADSVPALIPSDLQFLVPSSALFPSVTSDLTFQEFLDPKGRPIPATEGVGKKRSEVSWSQNMITESTPDTRTTTAGGISCQCSLGNRDTNGLRPEPREHLLKE